MMIMRKDWLIIVLLYSFLGISRCNKSSSSSLSSSTSTTKKLLNKLSSTTTQPSSNNNIGSGSSSSSSLSSSSSSSSTSLGPPGSPQLKPRILTLNVMVAGLSGLGKTTMCTSLMEAWKKDTKSTSSYRIEIPQKTMNIDATRLFERYDEATNTILRVRIIDTPGFGNRINYWNSVKPITSYINKCRNMKFVNEMSPITSVKDYVDYCNENHTDESLVHVCLYLISPGRFLEIDKHFLRHVKKEVTVVPIIAKADTLTDEEIARYRAELVKIFRRERLDTYNFDESPTRFAFYRGRRSGELLAIISRNGHYPWGKSSALDPNHSDLQLIRDLLLSEHTERFLELALVKYANYRSNRISRRKIQDRIKYVLLGGLVLIQMRNVPLGKAILASVSTHIPKIGRRQRLRSHQKRTNDDLHSSDYDEIMNNNIDESAADVGKEVSENKNQENVSKDASSSRRRSFGGIFGTPEYNSAKSRQ